MKFFQGIVLCLLLTTGTESKTNHLKDIAEFVYDVFTLGLDVSDRLESNAESEKVTESINELQKGITNIHSLLNFTKQLMEDVRHLITVQTYFESFRQHFDKVDSCVTDLQYVLNNPTDMVGRENFKECYNIMSSVRAIVKYIVKPIFLSKPLFASFNNEDGSCKGEDIEKILRALIDKFSMGCIITMAAERMKHNNSSTIYKDECWEMNKNVSAYIRSLYEKCINSSCSSFHLRVVELLNNLERVDSSTVYNVLQSNYPWLQFIVIEVWGKEAIVENNGTFFLHSAMFVVRNKRFQIFWTDVFVMFSKNRTNEHQKYVNVTISYRDFESLFFGMNLSYENPLETKRINVFGYTSDQTIDTCKHLPGLDDPSPAAPSAGNRLKTPVCMFVVIVGLLLELLKSLFYF